MDPKQEKQILERKIERVDRKIDHHEFELKDLSDQKKGYEKRLKEVNKSLKEE